MAGKPTYQELEQRVRDLERQQRNPDRMRSAVSSAAIQDPVDSREDWGADIEALELDEIINVAEIQSIMDDFYGLTHMVTAILDLKGQVIEATGWQDLCTRFHRRHPETAANCKESDLFLAKNLEPGEYVEYKCRNGLWDVVTPLYVGSRHLGNIYTGQFFYDDEVIDESVFIRQAERYGFDKEAYLQAFRKIPRFGRETVRHLMGFLVKFTAYISRISFANIRLEKEIGGRQRAEAEKARLEKQYHQSQKLESIGRLAGGIAHDLNNLLSPIIGYGEILMEDIGGAGPHREFLQEILNSGFRSRDLVRQLLALSRRQTLEYKPLDLNKTLKGLEKLLRRTIREDIEIKIDLGPRLPIVMADVGQIEQVIMNIVVNASDAMDQGGRLGIETHSVTLDADYAAIREDVVPGPYVMLSVSDSGCGMDAETLANIFEPFFSTKGEQGTGLGLATVYGIVKQHRGNIWVYSETGIGTTFKVYLPVSEDARIEDRPEEVRRDGLNGSETVLVVEDDSQVRQLVREILSRFGYVVLEAKDGADALEKLSGDHDGPVHLLLTDVIMPGINGKELFARAAEMYPDLKVLFMSGYTDNVIAHRGVLEKGVQLVQKPFSTHLLATKVRRVLDGPE